MAEAHSAAAFSVNIDGDDLSIFYDDKIFELFQKHAFNSYRKLLERSKNAIYNNLFPNRPMSFYFFVMLSVIIHRYSNLLNIPIIGVLIKLIGIEDCQFKSIILASVVSWIFYIFTNRLLLHLLLTNMSYMYMRPGQITLTFKIWIVLLKLVSSSKVKLYSFQRCLPILPVPSLSLTIKRYMKSIHPLLPEDEYSRIFQMANEFSNSFIAKKMQFYLFLKTLWSDNYVSDWWEEYVYLASRSPLISNSNFYGDGPLTLEESPKITQAGRSAMITYYFIQYRDQLASENRKPILIRDSIPMCSFQYERQFNTVRIPKRNGDEIKHYATSNHIVVLYRGRYFKVPLSVHGKVLRPCEFEYIFNEILNHESDHCPGEDTLAAFTASNRDFWADCRVKYFSSGLNKYSLEIIEKSAFVLVFDDEEFISQHYLKDQEKTSDGLTRLGKSALLGNGKNRWFDKSFVIIFGKNGQFCVNTEHSWADAPISSHKLEQVALWELEGVTKKTPNFHYVDGKCHGTPVNFLRPQRIKWNFNEECIGSMNVALKEAESLISDIDLYVLPFAKFGRNRIKSFKLSPDAFIQLLIQCAFYEDMGHFSLTYEACMTRLFRNGRTETVRSCSDLSCAFVRSLNNPAVSNKEKIALMREAADYHQNLYRDAMTGKGCDRHLFALYVMSKYLKVTIPFLDHVISQQWQLSTSQTPMAQCEKQPGLDIEDKFGASGGGFGPVADDGYGVSYIFSGGNLLYFHVSSKKACPKTDSARFARKIEEKLDQLSSLFD